jgi:hypothetical protein
MKQPLNQIVIIGTLSVIALACALFVDISVSMGRMFENILRSFGLRVGHASMSWDNYFFGLLGAASIAAFAGMALRQKWGIAVATILMAMSAFWTGLMFFAPQSWLETWFSLRIDRWPAAVITASMIVVLWRFPFRYAIRLHSQVPK